MYYSARVCDRLLVERPDFVCSSGAWSPIDECLQDRLVVPKWNNKKKKKSKK